MLNHLTIPQQLRIAMLINDHTQKMTATVLNTSPATIDRYLKDNIPNNKLIAVLEYIDDSIKDRNPDHVAVLLERLGLQQEPQSSLKQEPKQESKPQSSKTKKGATVTVRLRDGK